MSVERRDGDVIFDVFLSHSWADKPRIERLAAMLQAKGVSCWYDLMEVSPGDSLTDRLNQGLSSSKVILLCLSESFLEGHWSIKELQAAVGLSVIGDGIMQVVPLMLDDPSAIQQALPLPLADAIYLRWDDDDLDAVADQIIRVVHEVDGAAGAHWLGEARNAHRAREYERAVVCARKALAFDPAQYVAGVVYVASLLKIGRREDALRFITDHEETWGEKDEDGVDRDLLAYARDDITSWVRGDELDSMELPYAVVRFLLTRVDASEAWRHVSRLYDRPGFGDYNIKLIVGYAGIEGRQDAIPWLSSVALKDHREDIREHALGLLYGIGCARPSVRTDVVAVAERVLTDRHEKVRSAALIPIYFFSPQGPSRVVSALDDGAPSVRAQAFELLSGAYNVTFDGDMKRDEGGDRPADPLLTPKLVLRLLNDPDEFVFEEAVEAVSRGRITPPQGVTVDSLVPPPKDEIREARVRELAITDTGESFTQLKQMALEDPSEFVRGDAIEALEASERPLDDTFMETLLAREPVHDVLGKVERLVLKKGGSALGPTYLRLLEESEHSIFTSDVQEPFRRVLETGDAALVGKAFALMMIDEERVEYAMKHIRTALLQGFADGAAPLVLKVLDSEKSPRDAILAAGCTEAVLLDTLLALAERGEHEPRCNALRAIEWRLRDGSGLSRIRSVYDELRPGVRAFEETGLLWAALDLIDGMIEFAPVEEVLPVLEEYYDLASSAKAKSFPLRAAWERLRILGVIKNHEVYSGANPAAPYPWPDEEGPFYGRFGSWAALPPWR